MSRDRNCLSYWFPKLQTVGVPVPRTEIVQTKSDLTPLLDGSEREVYYPGRTRCPECGGPLTVDVNEWETDTGWPTEFGVEIDCRNNNYGDEEGCGDGFDHRWWQSDWQPAVDVVTQWARVHLRRV